MYLFYNYYNMYLFLKFCIFLYMLNVFVFKCFNVVVNCESLGQNKCISKQRTVCLNILVRKSFNCLGWIAIVRSSFQAEKLKLIVMTSKYCRTVKCKHHKKDFSSTSNMIDNFACAHRSRRLRTVQGTPLLCTQSIVKHSKV